MNRWWVVFGAILIQLSLGAIYAWSVFTPSLRSAGWSMTQTQIVFSVGLACFAISMVLSGRLLTRVGPRILAICGGIVLGVGYMSAGLFGKTDFLPILLGVGVVGGCGIGIAYIVPIAVGMKWFPDKKGLITGLAVAGFGFGAMFWIKLAGPWGHLIARWGIEQTFFLYGCLFLVSVVIGGIWMTNPPQGWQPPGWTPQKSGPASQSANSVSLPSRAMLKTYQFYMIFMTMLFGTGAGLMCIGLMNLFPSSALQANGFSSSHAQIVAGTAMGVFFALANGLGRIAWGAISDLWGTKRSVVVMTASQGVIVILFQWMAGTPALLYLGATMIGFNFGGNFALFPTITANTFGAQHVGENYGWVFLAYGLGGIFGPILGGRLGDMNNFPWAFTICGSLCIIAAIIISRLQAPNLASQTPAAAKAA